MESFIQFIFDHASQAHWILFGSLMLAGLNIPISEDLMIIIGALLAATLIPEKFFLLFSAIYCGCFFSDILVYWIGRTFGRDLWKIRWFYKTIPPRRLDQAHKFYKKYGIYTLLIGRFIPFGVRNVLFFTAGLSKMSFRKFLISDSIACFFSNSTLFLLIYTFGKNYEAILPYLKSFHLILFFCFTVTIISLFCYYKKRKKAKGNNSSC